MSAVKLTLREDQVQFIEAALMFIGNLCDAEIVGASMVRRVMAERTKERADEILTIIRDA